MLKHENEWIPAAVARTNLKKMHRDNEIMLVDLAESARAILAKMKQTAKKKKEKKSNA